MDERRYAEVMRDEIEHKPQSLDPDEEFPEPVLDESSVKHGKGRNFNYGLISVIILAAVIIGVFLLFALGLLI